MKVSFADRADKDYAAMPAEVRKAFKKQLGFLLNKLNHPSLRAKNTTREMTYGKAGSIEVGDSTLSSAETST